MAENYAPKDENQVPVILAQDSTDPTKVHPIKVDPSTGRIKMQSV